MTYKKTKNKNKQKKNKPSATGWMFEGILLNYHVEKQNISKQTNKKQQWNFKLKSLYSGNRIFLRTKLSSIWGLERYIIEHYFLYLWADGLCRRQLDKLGLLFTKCCIYECFIKWQGFGTSTEEWYCMAVFSMSWDIKNWLPLWAHSPFTLLSLLFQSLHTAKQVTGVNRCLVLSKARDCSLIYHLLGTLCEMIL